MATWVIVGAMVLLSVLYVKTSDNLEDINKKMVAWRGIAIATASEAVRANRRTLLMHALIEEIIAGHAADSAEDIISGITATSNASLPHTLVLRSLSAALHEDDFDAAKLDEAKKMADDGNDAIAELLVHADDYTLLQSTANATLSDADLLKKDAWIYAEIAARNKPY